jgi:hypothetical protein
MWQLIQSLKFWPNVLKTETVHLIFIARNEESGKVHIFMLEWFCECKAKIGILTKWHDSMWDNFKTLGEQEIDFSKKEWYSKIFDIKAPGL